MKKILEDFKTEVEKPINIYEDYSGAVKIAQFENLTKNSKYIELLHHFVNENYENGVMKYC